MQEYEGYNANDGGGTMKMWDGVITHLADMTGVTVTNSIELTNGIAVSAGYIAMLSADYPHVQSLVLDSR
ncbi:MULTISPECIES: hypothetical protein [Chelativorans]|uniref:hypothetical protein n=1 Tax=Chelativorans TaxID=449972 RepID=UPI00003A35EA|nr:MULTISPECIES: hypothetical protein [Chelativorans]